MTAALRRIYVVFVTVICASNVFLIIKIIIIIIIIITLLVTFSITELQRLFDACQRELCSLDMRINEKNLAVFELDQDVIQYVLA